MGGDAGAGCGIGGGEVFVGEERARTGELAGVGWRDRVSSSSGIGDGIGRCRGREDAPAAFAGRTTSPFPGAAVIVATLAVEEPETDE